MEYIERAITDSVFEKFGDNKVILITGARRVGKTVLLNELANRFEKPILKLNGEDLDAHALLDLRTIANYKKLTENVSLLIIDEAQAIPEIGKKMKLMIDEIKHLTILLTGSSALDLHKHTGEPLTGRHYAYKLYPVSQLELSKVENPLLSRQNLEDRLIFGSYPELLGKENLQKITYLKEIINSYLLRDLLAFEGIRNSGKLLSLLKLIAFQVGAEVSYHEMGIQLGISKNTVENYLDLLSKAYVIFKVGGYSGNLRKEVSKSAKWYFYDNGIRNAIISNYIFLSQRQDSGLLWENYLISERIKRNAYKEIPIEYYFWRTYDHQEIDWLEWQNGKLNAFEFKFSKNTAKVPAAFAKNYPESTFSVINRENYLPFITD